MSKSDLGLRRIAPAVWRYGLALFIGRRLHGPSRFPCNYTFGVRVSLFFPPSCWRHGWAAPDPGCLRCCSRLCRSISSSPNRSSHLNLVFGIFRLAVAFLFSALLISSWSAARRRVEHALKRARAMSWRKRLKSGPRTSVGATNNYGWRSPSADGWRQCCEEQASLLDLTHDTIFVRDMNDVITYWNRGAEERYGWSSEEAVGRVSHELTQTTFPAPLQEINAELLKTGQWEGELIHTRRDGTTVTVASRWALQRDEAQKPVAILETNNDISERKRAEDALRTSEGKYRD